MDDFDRVSWAYDLVPIPTHPKVLRRALAGRGGVVLDLGGGTGKYTARIVTPKDRTVVLDGSRRMVAQARRKRGLGAVRGMADRLPFADRSVDVVLCTEAFHHFGETQEAVLEEAARVLRPEGVLLLEEPDLTTWPGRSMAWWERTVGMESVFRTPDALAELVAHRFRSVTQQRSGRFTVLTQGERPRPHP